MRLIPQLLNNIHRQAQRGAQVVPSISGGSFGGIVSGNGIGGLWNGGSGQGGIDFARQVGDRFDISIVFAVIAFAARNIQSVPIHVYRLNGSNKAEIIPDHPIAQLLARPNPWYPSTLMSGLQIFAEMAWGSSYCYKHKDKIGRLRALEFLPVGACYPYTWPGTGEFISEYRISTPSGYYRVPPEDVLQLRYQMNPLWPAYGKTPLEALFPEVAADKMASRHEAALLDNGAVSSLFISPKDLGGGSDPMTPLLEFNDTQARDMESRMREKLTRDAKGSPFVATVPFDVQKIAFSPEELNCEYTHGLAEQRVCACFGFQPGAIGFGTGLREQNNRASAMSAIDLSVDQGLVPFMESRAVQLTFYLANDVVAPVASLQPGEFLQYDFSQLRVLKQKILREAMAAAGGPLISLNEGRAEIGREPVEGGDDYPVTGKPQENPEKDSKPNDKTA